MGCVSSKKQEAGDAGANPPKIDKDLQAKLVKETYLTEDEVASLYGTFMTSYPKGQMTKEQFTTSYKNMLPPEAAAFGDFVFDVTDLNRDGVVDFEEFSKTMSTINKGSVDEKIKLIFGCYDLDKTGKITREEMLKVFRAIEAGAPPDKDKPILSPEEKLKVVFAEMDKNQDNVIDMEEFVTSIKNRPSIIDPLPFFVQEKEMKAKEERKKSKISKTGSRIDSKRK